MLDPPATEADCSLRDLPTPIFETFGLFFGPDFCLEFICDVSLGEYLLEILEQAVVHIIGPSVLQGLESSTVADGMSVKVADDCRELHGASKITDVVSTALSFVGRQDLVFSSTLTVGVISSTEKQGRHDAVVLAVVGPTHCSVVSPLLVGGPGVFDGGTFPNILAAWLSRRDGRASRRVTTAAIVAHVPHHTRPAQ